MTNRGLAAAYLAKAEVRRKVLDLLLAEGAYSDVVREAQELVELALKAMLRQVGAEPPHWHDVSALLVDHAARLHPITADEIDELARISRWLRKEREFSFYGDIDFIPTEEYSQETAQAAVRDADVVLATCRRVVLPGEA
jgi:HEPN domain-containing protein